MTTAVGKTKAWLRSLIFTPRNLLFNRIDAPVIVLLYHRVTTLPGDPEMLAVSPDNFRAQLRHLKETVRLVRFEESWEPTSVPAVAVTFDDGYADNALEALPILEEAGVPATFFVATGTIGTDRDFWWHELERIILAGSSLPSSFTLETGEGSKSWPTGDAQRRLIFYRELVEMMKGTAREERDRWISQLRLWGGAPMWPADLHRAMSVEELRRLARSDLVTIGAHTVSHARLSGLPREAQREEIGASKARLEGWLGQEVTTFSYPFGRRCDYNAESVALCREAGFTKAAANFPGQAHRWTDPYRIPRHLVRNWTAEVFAEKLKGFWTR